MKKVQVAKTIEKFIREYGLDTDVRIYFSGKCWDFDSSGNKTIIDNMKGSDYCDYGNDDTITMTFEGALNEELNMYNGYTIFDKWCKLDFDNHYFEMGHSWSGSFFPN